MNPLTGIILGLSGLLGGLLGGGKTTQTNTTPSRMDPLYGILSPQLLGNMQTSMDWLNGWGGSKYFGFNPMVGQTGQAMQDYILAALTKQMPNIINAQLDIKRMPQKIGTMSAPLPNNGGPFGFGLLNDDGTRKG